MTRITLPVLVSSALTGLGLNASAASLQTQSNEVADGAIVVDFTAEGDRRLGWEGIAPYSPADVDDPLPNLSIESASIAHDSSKFYFRMFMDNFDINDGNQSFFGSFHSFYIDADQDRSTGYIGDDGDPNLSDGVLPIGVDFLIQGPTLFRFGTLGNGNGTQQEVWGWAPVSGGNLIYDDDPVSDIEFELSRALVNNPEAFDFFAITETTSFQTQDSFPNAVFATDGDFFTYSTVAVAGGIEGDYNDSGQVEQGDLDFVLSNWGDTDVSDVTGWTNFAGLPGDSIGGQVEQTELDLVLSNWGDTAAPDFTGSAVPEPATTALLAGVALTTLRRRR